MKNSVKYNTKRTLKDPGSAITHFIALLLSMLATILLLTKAALLSGDNFTTIAALSIFMISMMLLYTASTTYHSLNISPKINKLLRKIDHMMIFILIAGSYTPICLVVLGDKTGYALMAIVWFIAIVGIVIKALWITCPKWFSSSIYIGMGWVCVFAFTKIVNALPPLGFAWLLAGGIIYTIGGIIYALKLPVFNSIHKHFGSHEIFHLFVMAGSFCHYMLMYTCIA